MVKKLGALAKQKGVTPAQLTLAWLLAQGEEFIPIPGTKGIKYLEENWGSLGVELTEKEEVEIRDVVQGADVHGERDPEEMGTPELTD